MYTIIGLYITALAFIPVFLYIFKKYKNNNKDKFLLDLSIILISMSAISLILALGFTFIKYYSIAYGLSLVPGALVFGYLMKLSIEIYNTKKSYTFIGYITMFIYFSEIFLIPKYPLHPHFFVLSNTYSYGQQGLLSTYDTIISILITLIIVFNFLRFAVKIRADKFNRDRFLFTGLGILIAVTSITLPEIINNTYTSILGTIGYILGFGTAIIFISKKQI
ncbi:hypothetical protein M1145_01035 [Patescibacteria group bacterium]|nr:hypothetical protein [Patescibacteria group bacterium]